MPEEKQSNVVNLLDFKQEKELEQRLKEKREAMEEVYATGRAILKSWGYETSGDEGTQHDS